MQSNVDDTEPPYEVRILNLNLNHCGMCKSSNCNGCFLPKNESPCKLSSRVCFLITYRKSLTKIIKEKLETRIIHPSVIQKKEKSSFGINVYDCVRTFTKPERLGKDDAWYCSKCKEFRQATKKFDLWKMPEVLIIHLKRFGAAGNHRDKITSLVGVPVSAGLDLSPFAQDPHDSQPIYDLFAVSVSLSLFYFSIVSEV